MTEAVLTSHGTSHLSCLQIRIMGSYASSVQTSWVDSHRTQPAFHAFNMPRIRCSASTWIPKRKNVAILVVTVAERIALTNTNTNHHFFQVKLLKNHPRPPFSREMSFWHFTIYLKIYRFFTFWMLCLLICTNLPAFPFPVLTRGL